MYQFFNKVRFILAIPFALILMVLMAVTALIIFLGITIRRGSFKLGNKAAWQYLDILEQIRF